MKKVYDSTLIMTDFSSFSTLCEFAPIDNLWELIMKFQLSIIEIAVSNHGKLLNVSGDGLLIGFDTNASGDRRQSAYLACKSSVEIVHKIQQLNKKRINEGYTPLVTRIGINSGPIAEGLLSLYSSPIYLGQTINIVQRLEHEVAKQFGETSAVISRTTLEWLEDYSMMFKYESLGNQLLRGMQAKVKAYRLKGYKAAHTFTA